MTKKAIVWIREDLRIENNLALSYASQNHESVIVLYIYNNKYFDKKREAQKWWLSKSLEFFKNSLKKFNISLEIISGDEIEIFSKIKKDN
ncbi:deoxyribodipyrimidine photo-lyase, partial [Candidatus Pelagibacter sp.]|nr:deoxyribodipyrimidine photo-lyase [Candidatus Pelagibacter sp.]